MTRVCKLRESISSDHVRWCDDAKPAAQPQFTTQKGLVSLVRFAKSAALSFKNNSSFLNLKEYSWPLNNTSLKYMGSLKCGLFSLNMHYSTTQAWTDWIHGCGTVDTKGPLESYMQYLCFVQRSTYMITLKSSNLSMKKNLKIISNFDTATRQHVSFQSYF